NTTTRCGPGGISGGTCTVSVPSAVIIAVVSIVRIGLSPVSVLGASARLHRGTGSAYASSAAASHCRALLSLGTSWNSGTCQNPGAYSPLDEATSSSTGAG